MAVFGSVLRVQEIEQALQAKEEALQQHARARYKYASFIMMCIYMVQKNFMHTTLLPNAVVQRVFGRFEGLPVTFRPNRHRQCMGSSKS